MFKTLWQNKKFCKIQRHRGNQDSLLVYCCAVKVDREAWVCWNMMLVMFCAPSIRSSYVDMNKLVDTLMRRRKAGKVAVFYVTVSRVLCYCNSVISYISSILSQVISRSELMPN